MIVTENPRTGIQYRLRDTRGRQWFSHYSESGSGFGYLSWRMRRRVGRDWLDIGYGFPVWLYKGPFRVLFYGQIMRIDEQSGEGGDEIEVWASGWVHTATAEPYNYVYCDTRYALWDRSEEASGSFQPDKFDTDTSDRLWLEPRRSVDFEANDYTYMRYTFQFGEVAARIVADYDLALPNDWPGKLEIRDSGGTVLWSATATASGSLDLTTSGSPTYLEVRFYVTTAGENTADDDTVYGELINVKVYSVDETTLDAKVIADDLVDILSEAGHGLSTLKSQVEAPGLALEPAYFDRDMTAADVLTWCCKFGDSDGVPLAWGVTFDEHATLFLETIDRTTVGYVVKRARANLSRGGDWGETAQKAYGVYTDADGVVQRTSDSTDQDTVDLLGGYYRRVALQVSGVTSESLVNSAVSLWLAENATPGDVGSFTVRGGVWNPQGIFVPYDEVVPGTLVQIKEWRAIEASLAADDYRDKTTTFLLAGVKVDEEARTVELIPRTPRSAFARYMARLTELVS